MRTVGASGWLIDHDEKERAGDITIRATAPSSGDAVLRFAEMRRWESRAYRMVAATWEISTMTQAGAQPALLSSPYHSTWVLSDGLVMIFIIRRQSSLPRNVITGALMRAPPVRASELSAART